MPDNLDELGVEGPTGCDRLQGLDDLGRQVLQSEDLVAMVVVAINAVLGAPVIVHSSKQLREARERCLHRGEQRLDLGIRIARFGSVHRLRRLAREA